MIFGENINGALQTDYIYTAYSSHVETIALLSRK